MAGTAQDRGVAVVTGSVAGIGRGAALRLAQGGFAVACIDIQDPAPSVEAVRAAGGTAVMSNPLYTAQELGRQLTDTGARIVVTIPALAPRALAALDALGGGEVFVFGEADHRPRFILDVEIRAVAVFGGLHRMPRVSRCVHEGADRRDAAVLADDRIQFPAHRKNQQLVRVIVQLRAGAGRFVHEAEVHVLALDHGTAPAR